MSMKRSRSSSSHGSRYRDEPGEGPLFSKKAPEPQKSWAEHMEGKSDTDFVPYSLKSKFAKGTLIQHPTLGRGVVVAVDGPRIDVLFEQATKKLGHAG